MSNTIKKTQWGGGYGLLNHTAIPKKSKFFRPIIASPLVAMLGVSIANATGVQCNTNSNGSTPSLCFNSNSTNLNDLNFTISGNAFAPTSSNTPIENLLFKFYDGSGSTPTGSWDIDTKTYTITSPRGNSDKFTLSGNGRGMVMGANGTGTLSVDFAPSGSDNQRTFELKLEHVNASTLSFKGNIFIATGKGDGSPDETKNAKLDAIFGGKGMEGNIHIAHPTGDGGGDTRASKSEFVFENGANLNGNILAQAGTNNFTFKDGHIVGNVEYLEPHKHAAGKTTITFEGRKIVLQETLKVSWVRIMLGDGML